MKIIQMQALEVFGSSGNRITIIYALDDVGQMWRREGEVWQKLNTPFDAVPPALPPGFPRVIA